MRSSLSEGARASASRYTPANMRERCSTTILQASIRLGDIMRILIAHNAYQQRGGEDAVVEDELALLRSRGHAVETYLRHNDEIKGASQIRTAVETTWSFKTREDVTAQILTFRPDLLHVHNTFPLISPAIYWAADRLGVPVVQTLHNFRLMCLNALFLREGKVCEDCMGRLPWRGIVRKCYRDSAGQSAVVASMLTLHRGFGTYRDKVVRYIALNDFCRQKFIEGGLPAARIVVKPNFADVPAPVDAHRNGFLFVGRLSAEKGVHVLVGAVRQLSHVPVSVAGAGPEGPFLDGVVGLQALGALSGEAVRGKMSHSVALILPSIGYENFPRTLVEAFGCALPVIASRIGPMADLVDEGVTGLLFESGNAVDLAQKMAWAQAHPDRMAEMGRNARATYEDKYTPEQNYRQLMAIYYDAIEEGISSKSSG